MPLKTAIHKPFREFYKPFHLVSTLCKDMTKWNGLFSYSVITKGGIFSLLLNFI